jgi:hypothetical protein
MGWSTGSRLMSEVIEACESLISNYDIRVELYKQFINSFEDYDCDNLDECVEESTAFAAALKEVHPNWDDSIESYEEQD